MRAQRAEPPQAAALRSLFPAPPQGGVHNAQVNPRTRRESGRGDLTFPYCVGVEFLHGSGLRAAVGSGVTVIEYFGVGVPQIPHPGLLPLLLLRLGLRRSVEIKDQKRAWFGAGKQHPFPP